MLFTAACAPPPARLTGRWVFLASGSPVAVGQANTPSMGGPVQLLPGSPAAGACLGGICLDLACTNGPTLGPSSGFTGVRVRATSGLFRGVGSIVGDGAGTLYAQDPYGNGNSGESTASGP